MSGSGKTRLVGAPPRLDFGGLGLPAAPPRPEPAPPPVADQPAVAPPPPPQRTPSGADPVPAPRAGSTTARPKRRRRRPAIDGGTGVYLPVTLVERLRAYCAGQRDRTYTDTALDALDHESGRLAQLVQPAKARAAGSLFAGRQQRRVPHEEPHTQVNMRFDPADLATIDDLWPRVGAANRSALIAAALDAYLPPQRRG